jgi:hypothetical protein
MAGVIPMTPGASGRTLDARDPSDQDVVTRGDGPPDATQEDSMSDKEKTPRPEAEEPITATTEEEEADTEGHFFMSDPNAGRILAADRERQIQKNLQRHTVERTARSHKQDKR